MAIALYVGDPASDHVAIDVGDPGYGYVSVFHYANNELAHELTLRGRYMWRALENLTRLVCDVDGESRGDVDGLWPMTVIEAGQLLPAFQTAVLYAAAGGDRAERLREDEDGTADVLCAGCNLGSPYAGHVTTSQWCEQYGHQPFGYAGDWASAEDAVGWNRRWAEIHRRNEKANRVPLPADPVGQPE